MALCFFGHVILGSVMMVPPKKGMYSVDDLISVKLSLLNCPVKEGLVAEASWSKQAVYLASLGIFAFVP